ncbi:MAG: polyprenyl synthetase family protein, partial [Prevotella sp.]|nr:polyprenyl synthetase family protein [Prevotella sp.]
DIFDYFDSKDIGKPTGNDMMEGKLTLPIIYALNHQPNPQMDLLAQKVKNGTVKTDEIAHLVDFAKLNGGIEYAEKRMKDYHQSAKEFINLWVIKDDLKTSLSAYLDFVIERQI